MAYYDKTYTPGITIKILSKILDSIFKNKSSEPTEAEAELIAAAIRRTDMLCNAFLKLSTNDAEPTEAESTVSVTRAKQKGDATHSGFQSFICDALHELPSNDDIRDILNNIPTMDKPGDTSPDTQADQKRPDEQLDIIPKCIKLDDIEHCITKDTVVMGWNDPTDIADGSMEYGRLLRVELTSNDKLVFFVEVGIHKTKIMEFSNVVPAPDVTLKVNTILDTSFGLGSLIGYIPNTPYKWVAEIHSANAPTTYTVTLTNIKIADGTSLQKHMERNKETSPRKVYEECPFIIQVAKERAEEWEKTRTTLYIELCVKLDNEPHNTCDIIEAYIKLRDAIRDSVIKPATFKEHLEHMKNSVGVKAVNNCPFVRGTKPVGLDQKNLLG